MRTYQAQVAFDERADHAEGPLWDDVRGELLWVDLDAGLVRRASWDSPRLSVVATYSLGEAAGAVVPCADPADGWVVASEFGFARLGTDGSLRKLAEPERGRHARMNDGAADPVAGSGRAAWPGTARRVRRRCTAWRGPKPSGCWRT